MVKMNVGILFGGSSSEHEVSRVSAHAIIKNISKEKYNLFLIGITKNGRWYLFDGDVDEIPNGEWEKSDLKKPAFISPDSSIKGLIVYGENEQKAIKLDVVIPVLHGKNGEDGTVQGLLELAKIPFVGCHTAAAAACMDKVETNSMLAYNHISKPLFHWFYADEFEKEPERCIKETEKAIKKYPMFVKPANAGSSVGVSKVENKDELIKGIKIAAHEDSKILIEEGIVGKEVECAVLGNEEPIASVVGQIEPSNDFYDYDAKYLSNASDLSIPANILQSVALQIQQDAVKAYKIMGCSGLSRVDFFVQDGTGKVFLNEINTFPGFTSISMYPKLMEKSGVSFSQLIDRLVILAINKK